MARDRRRPPSGRPSPAKRPPQHRLLSRSSPAGPRSRATPRSCSTAPRPSTSPARRPSEPGPFSILVWVPLEPRRRRSDLRPRHRPQHERRKNRRLALSVHRDGRVRYCNWPTGGRSDRLARLRRTRSSSTTTGTASSPSGTARPAGYYFDGAEVKFKDSSTSAGWGPGREVGRSWTNSGLLLVGRTRDLLVFSRALFAERDRRLVKKPRIVIPEPAKPAGDAAVQRGHRPRNPRPPAAEEAGAGRRRQTPSSSGGRRSTWRAASPPSSRSRPS